MVVLVIGRGLGLGMRSGLTVRMGISLGFLLLGVLLGGLVLLSLAGVGLGLFLLGVLLGGLVLLSLAGIGLGFLLLGALLGGLVLLRLVGVGLGFLLLGVLLGGLMLLRLAGIGLGFLLLGVLLGGLVLLRLAGVGLGLCLLSMLLGGLVLLSLAGIGLGLFLLSMLLGGLVLLSLAGVGLGLFLLGVLLGGLMLLSLAGVGPSLFLLGVLLRLLPLLGFSLLPMRLGLLPRMLIGFGALLRLEIGALLIEPRLGRDLVPLALIGQCLLLLGLLLMRLLPGLLLLLAGLVIAMRRQRAGGCRYRHCGRAAMVGQGRRRRALIIMLAPVVEGARLLLAMRLFGLPVGGLFGLVRGVIGLPFGLTALLGRPLGAGGIDLGAAVGPVGGAHRTAVAGHRGGVDGAGPGQFARGAVGVMGGVGHGAAIAVVDNDQLAVGIAVAVVGVADEVGIVRAGLIIIVAVAAVDRFDQAHGVVAAAPGPQPCRPVVEAVVGRSVAEGVAHRIGAVDIGIGVVGLHHPDDLDGWCCGQGVGRGRRCCLGFRPGGQRHGQGGRAGRRGGGIGRGVAGGQHGAGGQDRSGCGEGGQRTGHGKSPLPAIVTVTKCTARWGKSPAKSKIALAVSGPKNRCDGNRHNGRVRRKRSRTIDLLFSMPRNCWEVGACPL